MSSPAACRAEGERLCFDRALQAQARHVSRENSQVKSGWQVRLAIQVRAPGAHAWQFTLPYKYNCAMLSRSCTPSVGQGTSAGTVPN
eukprot:167061-Chlamydomonas_euryale.AAC.3